MRSTGIVPKISYEVTVGEVAVSLSPSQIDLDHLAGKWAISDRPTKKAPRLRRGAFSKTTFSLACRNSPYTIYRNRKDIYQLVWGSFFSPPFSVCRPLPRQAKLCQKRIDVSARSGDQGLLKNCILRRDEFLPLWVALIYLLIGPGI